MYRRRRRRGKFIGACFILLLLGFIYGYMTNDNLTPAKPKNEKGIIAETSEKNPKKNLTEADSEDLTEIDPIEDTEEPNIGAEETVNANLVTSETKLIFKTYYEKSRDTVTEEENVPVAMVGETLKNLQDYVSAHYGGWSIRSIGTDFIELYRVRESVSPNYYIVKEKNGFIAIFQVDEMGNNILIDQTEIPTMGLGDIDRKKLQEGIPVKGIEGVNQILEDYSS